MRCMIITHVAFPSRISTLQIVNSKLAETIFLLVGFMVILSSCWWDATTLAYCFMLIETAASCLLFPFELTCKFEPLIKPFKTAKQVHTSSRTNVQSLSSNSWVLGSLNKVTATVWLSGTAQMTSPRRVSFMVGSQGRGSVTTLLLLLVKTTLSLFGFLEWWTMNLIISNKLWITLIILPFSGCVESNLVIWNGELEPSSPFVDSLQALPNRPHFCLFLTPSQYIIPLLKYNKVC